MAWMLSARAGHTEVAKEAEESEDAKDTGAPAEGAVDVATSH
jgi:hypothetical protein